mgnify:FL=1
MAHNLRTSPNAESGPDDEKGIETPLASASSRPGELWRSDFQDRLTNALAEYHGELMQKLTVQELMLKQMLAASHLEHALAEPFESEPLGPPVKEVSPVNRVDGTKSLVIPTRERQASLRANTMPDSKTSEAKIFSTFTKSDLSRQDVSATVDGEFSRERFANIKNSRVGAAARNTGDLVGKVVRHPGFDGFFSLVVILNSVFIGFEVEFSIQTPPVRSEFMQVCQYSFTGLFALELLLRIVAFGCGLFWSDDWMWAILDVFIVLTSFWEIVVEVANSQGGVQMESIAGVSSLKAFRIIRITRILKTVQLVRVMRFVVALRTLVTSIFHTLKSLVWALVLLSLIVYVFAVLFTQAVNDFVNDPELHPKLSSQESEASRVYYGSLVSTMLSLFMSITGGVSWEEVLVPLYTISYAWVVIYVFYISFTYFAVLNVVTGVFCQSAIDSAQNDHVTMMHAILANKESHLQKVKDLFNRLGAEKSGSITYLMFEEKINSPEVREYFQSLGLDVWDAWSFFKMLDLDESGAVDMDEFLMGCLRVRGQARAIDITKIIHDQTWQIKNQGKFQTYVEVELAHIKDSLLSLAEAMPKARRGV